MTTKNEQVREFIQREVKNALYELIATMGNRDHAEVLRTNRDYLSGNISWHFAQDYKFLELADIMEWRRTRVRR
jgi:hypothetical protein